MRLTASDWYDIGIRYLIQKELEVNPLLPCVYDDWIEAVHRARDGADVFYDAMCNLSRVFFRIGFVEMTNNIGPINVSVTADVGLSWSDAK